MTSWDNLASANAHRVTLTGYPVPFPGQNRAARFLLTREPGCCPGCAPRDPAGSITVEARTAVSLRSGVLRMTGLLRADSAGYRLLDARTADVPGWAGVTRRRALAAGPLMCLAAPAAAQDKAPATAAAQNKAAMSGPTVDIHSHAGGIASTARVHSGQTFGPVAVPMRAGGMAVICLAIVSDGPTHKVTADGRLHPFRDPEPGELYNHSQVAFQRVHGMIQAQGLAIIADAAGMRAATSARPSVVIASEGADFLDGKPDRVDEAYKRWTLRHLQLVHYRVNELGDIQTEPPVHGGLTDTGAEVIRRCNRLGVVVDVAHGTFDLVKRAAAVSTKPLVLSHTSLTSRPDRFTRLVVAEHAKMVAATGGVIGIWPPDAIFPNMDAFAAGIARMVDAVGVDHVGLGSDMRGLLGPSVLPDYDRLPALADALPRAGFNAADTAKILGGNYARVFQACMV